MKFYKKTLNFSIDHKAIVLVASVVLLAVSLVLGMSRGFEFMPNMPSSQLMISVELPDDTEFETTVEVLDRLSEEFSGVEGVQTVGAMMSSGMAEIVGLSAGSSGNTNSVTMYVITEENKKIISSVTDELMAIGENYDVEMSVSSMTGMSSIGALAGDGITINVYANELDDLAAAAEIIGATMANVEGIGEVDNGIGETAPEVKITVDKDKAMSNGLTVAQVYVDIAKLLTDSKTATALAYEQGSRDVVIKGDAEALVSLEELREHVVIAQDRQGNRIEVPLAELATITMGESLQSISRSAQRRTLSITGSLEDGYNVTLVASAVMEALNGVELPAGVVYESTGENETIMTALKDLGLMLLLGVAIVYLIMVAQFQSLLSPFIVMFTIPLSFTGGMFALLICGMRVSIVAMIGFIMLVGIIVNNGIVLIDYINLLRRDGMPRREAILDSCVTRLRPVLMTALTTILGLLPMALGIGSGADLMQPIAVVCIGGLLYATVMTLVVIPVMYDIMCKKEPRRIEDRELEVVAD